MSGIWDFIRITVASNRVRAIIFAIILAWFKKHFPNLAPTEETLNWVYSLILALILGDSIRPIDPRKKGIFDEFQFVINNRVDQ